MASYFDIKPSSKSTADAADEEEFGRPSMLTPQVTRILEDKDLEEHSGSDDDSGLDGDSDSSDTETKKQNKSSRDARKAEKSRESKTSSTTKSGPSRLQPLRPDNSLGTGQQKHPHMARFHSLRSMLFLSHIEDDIRKNKEEPVEPAPEEKWKSEHEQRRALNRPRTPESPKGSPTKEGFRHKLGDRLRRMTTKDNITLGQIREGVKEDHVSTASSGSEDEQKPKGRPIRDTDEESIDHSDIEDLVRWVSRHDPPSDGEARKAKGKDRVKEDSGHESLGHSDVDDLVRWVSRRSAPGSDQEEASRRLSDAPTEPDSEGEEPRKESMSDQDVDELVRWVSHKEGPKAGPVLKGNAQVSGKGSTIETNNSNVPEFYQPTTRNYNKSNHLNIPKDGSRRPAERSDDPDQESRGRSRSRQNKESLQPDDVDELVKWVSRRDPNPVQVEERDDRILEWKRQEDDKKAEIGMTADKGSLAPEDVDDLVKFASGKRNSEATPSKDAQQDIEALENEKEKKEKKEKLGMRQDEGGSLGPEDVDELLKFVKSKEENKE